jgi:hypothetical protein
MKLGKGFKIFLISSSFVIILTAGVILYFYFSYKSWEKEFESKISSNELVTENNNNDLTELEEKIEEINYTLDDTVALELTPVEVSTLVFNSLKNNNAFDVEEIYTDPIEKGRWYLDVKIKILEKVDIWCLLDIRKDERETAEIYLKDIYIGKYSLENLGFDSIVNNVNTALSSSLVSVDENDLSERSIDNIELLETEMVVKLTKF